MLNKIAGHSKSLKMNVLSNFENKEEKKKSLEVLIVHLSEFAVS